MINSVRHPAKLFNILGITERKMLLTGQAKKNKHKEAYPDKYKPLEEFLKLGERLKENQEDKTLVFNFEILFCWSLLIYFMIFHDIFSEYKA